ncbi:MAG: SGNH/GDSL hydrolase family protein [Thermoleophilia bacterium]|nr:SGNH/GDSL hydrolase family protein [Thermoleophilia bacterium]
MRSVKIAMLWLVMLATGLGLGVLAGPGDEPASATDAGPASCTDGAIEYATLDQSSGADGLMVHIAGHTSFPAAESVSVWLEGVQLESLPVDVSGDFNGYVTIPGETPDGDHEFILAAGDCVQTRTVLCIGDSITEGSFATSGENAYASLLEDSLSMRNGDGSWQLEVYGASGYGSLILDNIFNQPFYQDNLNPPPYFPRNWWKDATPDLVVIELGVNNLPGLDWSTRYGSFRGYSSEDEAIAWWKADVMGAVDYLVNQKGVTAEHILILGQWPFGSPTNYRGERYAGGDEEDLWNRWNAEMENQTDALGCRFVPMADVFGIDYIPSTEEPGGDPENLIDHEHGNSNVHPNDHGMQLFASRIADRIPPEFSGGERYSLEYTVDTTPAGELPLTLAIGGPYWANYADYASGLLSVDFILRNIGGDTASSVQIVGCDSTNGAICISELPVSAGEIPAYSQTGVTLRYAVPPGVSHFRVSLAASALEADGTEHFYPRAPEM